MNSYSCWICRINQQEIMWGTLRVCVKCFKEQIQIRKNIKSGESKE